MTKNIIMARSLSLPMLALAMVVFFLALVPAPLVLSAIRPPVGRIGRFSVRPAQAAKIRNFLTKHAGDLLDVIQNILPPSRDTEGDKLDTAAAHSAGLYTFNLPVGTSSPQQDINGVLDITLSFVWVQCESCSPCLPAPAPTFQPSTSPTFSTVPCASQTCKSLLNQTCSAVSSSCEYIVDYGYGTNTTGDLANDTFTFGQSLADGVLFGCSEASFGDFSGASGSFGFGRGRLSLVSQLQLSWFSYFLASDDSDSDNLLQFGDDAVPRPRSSLSTPLVSNVIYPDLYYVKLTGIQVDGQDLVDIPAGTFDLQADGSGGVFLSTTSPVTYLEKAAYDVLRRALASRIASDAVNGSELGLDLCYTTSLQVVPKLTLVFDGANAAMELRKHNYFFADNATGLECLTILPSRGGSVLGSLLQADTTMTYDIDGVQLIFKTAFAPPPYYSKVSLMVVLLVAWVLLF